MCDVQFVNDQEGSASSKVINHLVELAKMAGLTVGSLDDSALADPMDRAKFLIRECRGDPPKMLVGFGSGGWVATAASLYLPVQQVLLLAPTFFAPGYKKIAPASGTLEIVHGWKDEVVPCDTSIRFGQTYGATVHLVRDDHSFANQLGLIGEYFNTMVRRLRD